MGTRASLILAFLLALLPPVGGAIAIESGTEQGHQEAECALCHQFDGGAGSSSACLSCHRTFSSAGIDRLGFHGQAGRQCGDCHSFHEPERMVTALGRGSFPQVPGSAEGHCAACHGMDADLSLVSLGHRAAAELYHGGELQTLTPSEACLSCHGQGSSQLSMDLIPAGTPVFNEQASHAYGVTLVPGTTEARLRIRNVLDPRIKLFDQRIECSTCHQLAGRDEDLLVEFDGRSGLCRGCHEQGMDTGASEMLALGNKP